ncbi:hypothetical protein GCM10022222_83780 [Amycolatopsis ultiminotia]|uniref:Uncharacterized protein n=1 Tax=Amycolatopsis ultiminotia TaxID=543629 RepID=A0ABP6YLY4_9PSEU
MSTNAVGARPTQYAQRSLTAQSIERYQEWTVKRYAVSALAPEPGPEVHEFARAAVALSLPSAEGTALPYAFSVVHEDEDGCYVVVGWWSPNRLILHTRTWLGEWPQLSAPTEAPADATACIWEMVAIGHERDAWVRYVVRPAEPDLEAYLGSTISGQF